MRALTLVFCLFAACATSAQHDPAAAARNQATGDGGFPADPYYVPSPDQMIRQGIDRLVGFLMGSREPDPMAVRQFVEMEIAPNFDFGYMARWAAGPLWHRLGPQHRAALAAKLRLMFLDALARHLGTVDRPLPRVDVFPARPGRTLSDAVVHARVLSERRPPVRLEFRFYWGDQGWKVYDAVANGASAVAFFRAYFTRELRRHGPDVVLR